MFASNKKIRFVISLFACIMLTLVALGPSGMAATPKGEAATTLSSATVLPDGYVTFTLKAPLAIEVALNWQNMVGPSPRADPIPMTKDANGVWSVTIGPLAPN